MTAAEEKKPQDKALCQALAINRAMEYLEKYRKLDSENIANLTDDQLKAKLPGLLESINKAVLMDWEGRVAGIADQPGNIAWPLDRQEMRAAVHKLAKNLYDQSGFLHNRSARTGEDIEQARHDIAQALSEFYHEFRDIDQGGPFAFENALTLNLFLTALTGGRDFKNILGSGSGIDFRRLNKEFTGSPEDFYQAMNPRNIVAISNRPDGYSEPAHDSSVMIGGIPFLGFQKDGKQYLVTMSGGLVPLEKIEMKLENELLSNKHFASFAPVAESLCEGSIDEAARPPLLEKQRDLQEQLEEAKRQGTKTDELESRLKGVEVELSDLDKLAERRKGIQDGTITDVDGFSVSPNASPLCCLDVSILTGLRKERNEELLKWIHEVSSSGADILSLVNDPSLQDKMRKTLMQAKERAGDDKEELGAISRRASMLDIACEHLGRVVKKLEAEKEKQLEGKRLSSHPLFFMSMGGNGAGKSSAESMAAGRCKDSGGLVVPTLDGFRDMSDSMALLRAANHHSDDYRFVDDFANTLRSLVAKEALEQKLNVFYDGTGIPYDTRDAKQVKRFKEAGYETTVIGIDARMPLIADRVKNRFYEQNRTLPWRVIISKHASMPHSFLAAVQDGLADKVCCFSSDDKPRLIAEAFPVEHADTHALEKAARTGGLEQKMRDFLLREDALCSQYPDENNRLRPPLDDEKNLSYLRYGNRVLLIYDVARFQEMIEKQQMNQDASSLEATEIPGSKRRFQPDSPSSQLIRSNGAER